MPTRIINEPAIMIFYTSCMQARKYNAYANGYWNKKRAKKTNVDIPDFPFAS